MNKFYKNLLIFSYFLVYIFCFQYVRSYAYTVPESIDAGIFYGADAKTEFNIKASSVINTLGEYVYSSDITCDFLVKKAAGNMIEVYLNGNVVAAGNLALVFESHDGYTGVSEKFYRGKIKVAVYDNKLTVINRVGLDDYVKGVVAKEMSPSWHIEALKAQAVCARNYAVSQIGRHKSSGFDVCCTQHCQVYGGLSAETESTNAAVNDTLGVIALYDGKPASLFFSAAAGGNTEDVKNVWGSSVPYLVSVDSSYENDTNPYYRWEYKISKEKAAQLLSSYGLGDILDISIDETSPAGAVTKLRVTGSNGEKIFTLEGTRTLFGYGALKSQAYTLEKGGSSTVAVISSDGVHKVSSFYTINADQNKFAGASISFALSADGKTGIDLSASEYDFIFKGRGFGHLVGLSQYGAYEMAKAGFGYKDIIKHYFKGVSI